MRPEDFDGAFIGVRASALAKRSFEQLGATVEFSSGDDFTGYDGIESDLRSIEGERTDEGAASLAPDVSLWPRVQVIVANRQAWEACRRSGALRSGKRAAPR